MNNTRKPIASYRREMDGAIASRRSAERIVAALRAIPMQDDYTRDAIETWMRVAEECDSTIDDVIERATADGYDYEDF